MSATCPSLAPLPLTFRGQRRATDGALDRPGEMLGSLGHHTRIQRPRRRTPSRKACQHRIALCADGIGRKPGGDAERGISFAARLFSKKRRLPSSLSSIVYVFGIDRSKWSHRFRRPNRSSVAVFHGLSVRRQRRRRGGCHFAPHGCADQGPRLSRRCSLTLTDKKNQKEKRKKERKAYGRWNDDSSGFRWV